MSLVSLPSWGENLTIDDLLQRNELYYKKLTNVPFTGKISGVENGSIKKGRQNGEWVSYHKNGQLWSVSNYNDGELDGHREYFNKDGSLKRTETFKDGVKLSD